MKNNLIEIKENKVLTTSLKVAERFEKSHKHVIDKINNLIDNLTSAEKSSDLENAFYINKNIYKDIYNRNQPLYEFDKDFFTLLVMGFTGEKALKFKIDYINAFNQMEQQLKTGTYTTNKQDYKLYNLSFPLNIFSRTSLRYKIIDNIPYFIDNDIFSIIGLDNNYKPNNINETLSKLNITRLLISPNEMIFGLNISQIFEILAYVKNERCKLLKKFLVSSDVIEKLFIETNLIN